MSEKSKDVEKMIAKVMKKKDLTRNAAMDYMLAVGAGRLAALWRYDDTLPEGKNTKGVFELRARKKPAEKTSKIDALVVSDDTQAVDKPKAKSKRKSKSKSKPQPKVEQIEIAAAE